MKTLDAVKLPVESIKIKRRIRNETGDLAALVDSMKRYGLLNPVTVNKKNELVAGFRRLQAARQLGWPEIECRVVQDLNEYDRVQLEADENMLRKDFTIEEIMEIEELKTYMASRGWRRFVLWIKRIISSLYLKIRNRKV